MDKAEKLIKLLESPEKIVGSKQVLKGMSDGTVRCVIVALDTDADLKKKIVAKAKEKSVEIFYVNSKKKLGDAVGIEVNAAVVGVK